MECKPEREANPSSSLYHTGYHPVKGLAAKLKSILFLRSSDEEPSVPRGNPVRGFAAEEPSVLSVP